jgi:hypothetical protein
MPKMRCLLPGTRLAALGFCTLALALPLLVIRSDSRSESFYGIEGSTA